MAHLSYLSQLISLTIALLVLVLVTYTKATTIDVVNNCPFTVWAAASPGGGKQLNQGDTWPLNPADGTKMARIWARTGCNFDANGNGHCDTGDCGGVLDCTAWGTDPQTLAEYTLAQPNNPTDTIDISLVEGFNVPLDFTPTTNGCRGPTCSVDLNAQCPDQLKTTGGCNNPCTVFKTVEYCCTPVRGSCGPTPFSQYFKQNCPDAYSYPQDDPTSTFSCPQGTNYKVTFCPYFGPFRITAKIGEVAYKLELPDHAKIHPMFHVSQLRKHHGPDHVSLTLPMVDANLQLAAEPVAVLERKMSRKGMGYEVHLLVQWSNGTKEDATWEVYDTFVKKFPDFNLNQT